MGLTGAILGDIAGSRFEFWKTQFLRVGKLFHDQCRFTDDTVMSLATANALLNSMSFQQSYRELGRKHINAGYGGMFHDWLLSDDPKPYNSFGNGSAMRVSYIGEVASSVEEAVRLAEQSASCTHNHPEGIKGAISVAHAIYLARNGISKGKICKTICETYGYNIDSSIAEIRPASRFDVTCQGSIPLALRCFYESQDYESCIRNAIETRCDRDTIACICGSIAESYYGNVGVDARSTLSRYLTDDLMNIWDQAMRYVNRGN